MNNRELIQFAQRLNAEIQGRVESGLTDGNDVYSQIIFTEQTIEFLEGIGVITNASICHHESSYGRGIVSIFGYAINDDEDGLDLFTTIHTNTPIPKQISKEDISRAVDRTTRFFEASCKGFHQYLEPAREIYGVASRINFISEKIDRLRVFVFTDGISTVKKIDPREIRGTRVQYEIWDIERIFRGMLPGLSRDEINVDFQEICGGAVPCLMMPNPATDYNAYLAILPAELLYNLYEEYGTRLLELNVRSFLGIKGNKTVNSGIRKTLREEPDRFLAYNNGIVVTVDSISTCILPDGRLAIRSVKGLQIVNGGQTTASIHRTHKYDKADISSVFVPAKISVIDPKKLDEMVQMISHFANSQNTVQPADFSANNPFHVKIEDLSNTNWCADGQTRWFYERARGSYQVALAREGTTPARIRKFKERTPPHRKITKTELAKSMNAWGQKPHMVSYGSQKNFDYFMQNLRNTRSSDWVPDQKYFRNLVAITILYRSIQKTVRQEKFPAHQANIVAYLVSYVSWRTSQALALDYIWNEQKISDVFNDLLRSWAHAIDDCLRETAQNKMVTEWAKKEACWERVRDLPLPLPNLLPAEMIGYLGETAGSENIEGRNGSGGLAPEDFENIDICKTINGDTWLRIHGWGKKSGLLKGWQAGIAHTLASYASMGWDKNPSPKQARQGVLIIKLAQEAGLFDKE